jgi:hypothetical protein
MHLIELTFGDSYFFGVLQPPARLLSGLRSPSTILEIVAPQRGSRSTMSMQISGEEMATQSSVRPLF